MEQKEIVEVEFRGIEGIEGLDAERLWNMTGDVDQALRLCGHAMLFLSCSVRDDWNGLGSEDASLKLDSDSAKGFFSIFYLIQDRLQSAHECLEKTYPDRASILCKHLREKEARNGQS